MRRAAAMLAYVHFTQLRTMQKVMNRKMERRMICQLALLMEKANVQQIIIQVIWSTQEALIKEHLLPVNLVIHLSVNHAFDVKAKWQKSFVVGLKLPFDGADIVENGIHLPMPYQTSLGTTDLVLAINYNRKNFGATLAVQQPLKPINENKFLPGDYPNEPLALNYWPTNEFSRKGDVVGRVSYNFKTGERSSIRPSLLGIYHETNDTYLDDAKNRRPVYNSKGLTLNANVFVDYRLKNGNGFELSLGTPFIVRDQRPDGLTRSFVASLEYQFSF